ncbi:hypothetical protein [Flammeovirga sp. SJP92]|uniref:hypothetical protein n=1 Tax=Flammeovirga sp. SJP92 TaxID=1775430 RepID=UPI000787231B|nr:hypothetical protein [Flammeovirga sp. SJP92]KXX70949.1 hypothetical protein AVL50_10825 [Flammeovirga sp. SJP92]
MKIIHALFLSASCFLASCDNSDQAKSSVKTEATTSTEEVLDANTHKIVVNEKIASGGYVYIKVTEKGKEYWMAVPGRPIEIGATYYYDGGMEMQNFESKTLNRTFESVIFAEGIRDQAQKVNKTVKKSAPQGSPQVKDIDKAPNGIRIAELFNNMNDYSNKEVIIKGQVVKVNNGVMNVNFVHLQDGTIGNGQYDITVTTDDNFSVGEVVTIKGNVILNKDFGAGYTYDVLVEKAVKL